MHLAVEAVGVKHSGGAVVLLDVIRAALSCPAITHITVFCSPRKYRRFDFPADPRLHEEECESAEQSNFARMLWYAEGLDRRTREAEIVLCMSGIGFTRVPSVAFVHQALPFCPQALSVCDWKTKLRIRIVSLLMRTTCTRAALIVTQTPTMTKWVCSNFSVNAGKAIVVKPFGDRIGMGGESGQGSVRPMLSTPVGQRLLYVGNTSAYKNLRTLVAAMPAIRRHNPGATLFLTCDPLDRLCNEAGVVGLGYLEGAMLEQAYSLATVFVTPSLVESGNLTLIEAMRAGTPVSCADRPYARELCGNAAEYFDPLDKESIAAVLVGLLGDDSRRRMLSALGLSVVSRGTAASPYQQLLRRITSANRANQDGPEVGQRRPRSA